MLKAVALEVLIWIEGEDEPVHNFVESSKEAVKEILTSGMNNHPGLKLTIRSIKERTMSVEDPEDTDDSGDEF